MVDMTVLGLSLQSEGGAPVLLLLHPHGTGKILSLAVGPMEAFAISTALQCFEDAAIGRGGLFGSREGAMGQFADSSRSVFGAGLPGIPGAPPPGMGISGAFLPGTDSPSAGEPATHPPRPLSHDLMLRILQSLGGCLLGVELRAMEEGLWFADAVIAAGPRLTRLDCRPSDGIALALRCGALLRIHESLLEHAEPIPTVLARLPEHVRTVALARIAAVDLARGTGHDFSRIPLVVSSALAARDASAAQSDAGAVKTASGRIVQREVEGKAARSAPSIRISLVRQDKKGDAEVLEEFRFPAEALLRKTTTPAAVSTAAAANRSSAPHPGYAPASLVNPLDEGGEGVSEDERWTALLRVLAPETKVLM